MPGLHPTSFKGQYFRFVVRRRRGRGRRIETIELIYHDAEIQTVWRATRRSDMRLKERASTEDEVTEEPADKGVI